MSLAYQVEVELNRSQTQRSQDQKRNGGGDVTIDTLLYL